MEEVNRLESREQFVAAGQLLGKNWRRYPEKRFELIQKMVVLNEKDGHLQKNLVLWNEGHSEGLFFLIHPNLPQYKNYLEIPGFDITAIIDQQLRVAALGKSQTRFVVRPAVSVVENRCTGTLFIFHGGGSSLAEAQNRWEFSSEFQSQFNLVFLQSYRFYDCRSYGWRTGDDKGLAQLDRCYQLIKELIAVDPQNTYLTGVSAGASMAIDVALREIIPARGIIAFCPGFPRDVFNENLIVNNDPVISIVAGEEDFYRRRQTELMQTLDSTGFEYISEIITGFGHDLPGNFEEYILSAVNWPNRSTMDIQQESHFITTFKGRK